MSTDPDKEVGKNPDEKPKKEKKRKLWLYRMKVISVDEEFVTYEDEGKIHRLYTDGRILRTPEYRRWLVDSGYWIPSMDLRESGITIDLSEYTVEDEEEEGGVTGEPTESLEERMKKLKAQQQGNFKKYYERKASKKKDKKSKNSKSTIKKREVEVKKKSDQQKVEIVKTSKPKSQEVGVEKAKKVDPPKSRKPKVPVKAAPTEVNDGKVEKQDPPKIQDLKAHRTNKPDDPPLKEPVRSHYCYTEMHLVSGKEIKKKI